MKPTSNLMLHCERLNASPKNKDQGKDVYSHHSYSTLYRNPITYNEARKRNKKH